MEVNNDKNDIIKKKIHFILPGGGVNGVFQAGFLYRLFKDCKDHIDISRIDGISVGALNGLGLILEDIEFLKNIWYHIENRDYVFNSHLTNTDVWKKGSLYDNTGLKELIFNHKDFICLDKLDKYNCVVHNCTTQDYQYINGINEHILDFILASASPPIISPYSKIGDDFYSDGCIDQVYPINSLLEQYKTPIDENPDMILSSSINNLNVVVGYYNEDNYYLFNIYKQIKTNIKNNSYSTKELIEKKILIPIINPCRYVLIDFNREAIDAGFKLGEDAAIDFYNTYIMCSNQSQPSSQTTC